MDVRTDVRTSAAAHGGCDGSDQYHQYQECATMGIVQSGNKSARRRLFFFARYYRL